jgi:hypothetical protein
MAINAEEARDLARSFREFSKSLGDYRFDNWDSLTKAERQEIENMEWTSLNYSSDFTTTAVGLTLDNVDVSVGKLVKATNKARQVVAKIEATKRVIAIGSAALQLAAAIASGGLGAIAEKITALNALTA